VTLNNADMLALDEVDDLDLDTMKKSRNLVERHLVEHFSKSNQQCVKHNRITWTPIMENSHLVWLLMLSHDGGLLTLCVNA
jgi:hypothetical protein